MNKNEVVKINTRHVLTSSEQHSFIMTFNFFFNQIHYTLAHVLSSLALALGLASGAPLSRPCFFMAVAIACGDIGLTNLADHPLTLYIAMVTIRKIRGLRRAFVVSSVGFVTPRCPDR